MTRWVRKLDIGEVRVVVDGVGCTFRVNGGYRIERRTVRPRDRDTSVIAWCGISPVVDER